MSDPRTIGQTDQDDVKDTAAALALVTQEQNLEHEVHIWRVSADAPTSSHLRYYAGLLSDVEEERLRGFKTEEAHREFLVSHGVLRHLLGLYLNVAPVFSLGQYGKPALAFPKSSLTFNLSHSHGEIVLAFTKHRHIGIDIEMHDVLAVDPAMFPTLFTPRECRELQSLPSELLLNGFFSAWTRKEAFIKATGLGFSADLQSFEVTVDPREPVELRLLEAANTEQWQLSTLDLWAKYEAALVVSGGDFRPHLIDGDPLLHGK